MKFTIEKVIVGVIIAVIVIGLVYVYYTQTSPEASKEYESWAVSIYCEDCLFKNFTVKDLKNSFELTKVTLNVHGEQRIYEGFMLAEILYNCGIPYAPWIIVVGADGYTVELEWDNVTNAILSIIYHDPEGGIKYDPPRLVGENIRHSRWVKMVVTIKAVWSLKVFSSEKSITFTLYGYHGLSSLMSLGTKTITVEYHGKTVTFTGVSLAAVISQVEDNFDNIEKIIIRAWDGYQVEITNMSALEDSILAVLPGKSPLRLVSSALSKRYWVCGVSEIEIVLRSQ